MLPSSSAEEERERASSPTASSPHGGPCPHGQLPHGESERAVLLWGHCRGAEEGEGMADLGGGEWERRAHGGPYVMAMVDGRCGNRAHG